MRKREGIRAPHDGMGEPVFAVNDLVAVMVTAALFVVPPVLAWRMARRR